MKTCVSNHQFHLIRSFTPPTSCFHETTVGFHFQGPGAFLSAVCTFSPCVCVCVGGSIWVLPQSKDVPVGETCAAGSRRTSGGDGSVDGCLSRFGGPAIRISPQSPQQHQGRTGRRRMERWMEEEGADCLHGVTPSQPY